MKTKFKNINQINRKLKNNKHKDLEKFFQIKYIFIISEKKNKKHYYYLKTNILKENKKFIKKK
jgi:hypothetical protein